MRRNHVCCSCLRSRRIFEVVPPAIAHGPLFKWFNTLSHHDARHTNSKVNFAAFFNIWNRFVVIFEDAGMRTLRQKADF